MDYNTYYQKLRLNIYSDIALGSTILIIIGRVIGIIGNITIIFLYFFRIKEKGERYFIPLLAVVDLLGCLANPPYYILDTENLYNFPSFIGCKILMFLHFCIPGMSGHTLLLILIQRYMLVSKPFRPKMTLFWKRVSFGIVCLVSLAYSIPLLATAGVYEKVIPFMNQNVTTEVCKFFSGISMPMTAYVTLLLVLMVVNIVLTVGFYIPVLMRIAVTLRFSSNKYEVNRDSNAYSHGESSQATRKSEIDIGSTGPEKIRSSIKMKDLETNKYATTSTKRVYFEVLINRRNSPSQQLHQIISEQFLPIHLSIIL
uniref:C3a anaphylatoxin chemotactic receptor-like n=1 Tax=Crassostrea virginica TaxID=6565 RepID=A0A8B8BD56_CRAVI|nr:C3a anaphylatoxin chemotactic receptor-like [Crassostrea virginica]